MRETWRVSLAFRTNEDRKRRKYLDDDFGHAGREDGREREALDVVRGISVQGAAKTSNWQRVVMEGTTGGTHTG